MPRRSTDGLTIEAKYARITTYEGKLHSYQPDPSEKPTPNNEPKSAIVSPSVTHSGHTTTFRSFEQPSDVRNWRPHNYAYGASKKRLRPVVPKESEINWMEWEFRSRQKRRNWTKKATPVSEAA